MIYETDRGLTQKLFTCILHFMYTQIIFLFISQHSSIVNNTSVFYNLFFKCRGFHTAEVHSFLLCTHNFLFYLMIKFFFFLITTVLHHYLAINIPRTRLNLN